MKPLALDSLLRPSICAIKPYQSAREEFIGGDKEMILLDANENPYPSGVNRYPDPLQSELKKALSIWKKCDPNQLFLSNGSDEVIAHLITAFCEPTLDHIVLVPPTFGMYAVTANILGIAQKSIPLTAHFQLDVEAILDALNAHSKLLFIPTPNNPTGNSFKHKDLIQLLESFPGLVCIDEAYIEFAKAESLVSKLNRYPNLVIMQTFSKAQGMAGIRLGITFAQKEVVSILNTIKAPYNINALTQKAALTQLEEQGKINTQVATLLNERDRLMEAIASLRFVETVYPSDANFFLIRVDNSQKRYEELLNNGIVVRHMGNKPQCENTLRISVGKPEENEALLLALDKMNKE
jgi:histidinol-phosphate aminotransferase